MTETTREVPEGWPTADDSPPYLAAGTSKAGVTYSVDEARAKNLQALAQGEPISVEKIAKIYESRPVVYVWNSPASNAWQLHSWINTTATVLNNSGGGQEVRAILNALGWSFHGSTEDSDTLTKRRMRLLEKEDITIRALQDRESRGALVFVKQMQMIADARPELLEIETLKGELTNIRSDYWKLYSEVAELRRIVEAMR